MELTWQLFDSASKAERILVLAPSLGGHAEHQWAEVARRLSRDARVVLIYLPGHGPVAPWDVSAPATLDALASGIVRAVGEIRGRLGELPVYYAGLSVSGAVGLHLARDHAPVFDGIVVVGSAAKVGESSAWLERAEQVERDGTAPLAEATGQRWFTPAFAAKEPAVVETLLRDIAETDNHSYAQLCRALAVHDVRHELGAMPVPLLLIAGEQDASTPLENVRLVADGAPDARLVVIPGVAHQVPVSAPVAVAERIREFVSGA